jgi:uncharacterized protein (UPF0264 family)
MTQLLVSVRNAAEAALAAQAGADVIDVKEPARGPLGAADARVIAAVLDTVAGRIPVSAALGELQDWQGDIPASIATRLRFIKFGLAGCGADAHWCERLRAAWADFADASGAPSPSLVAVVYADWEIAKAPPPAEVLASAARLNATAVLVDTFDKQGLSLPRLWTADALRGFVDEAQASGLLVALAGGLTLQTLPLAMAAGPDLIGVRGAACSAGCRGGAVEPARVRQLVEWVGNFAATAGAKVS